MFQSSVMNMFFFQRHNTAKGLIGIAPHGAVTFVSELYGGHCSDKANVENCGILQLLEEGDSIMADIGFEIQDLLAKKKVYLNIPPFMRCKDQLSPEEEDETRDVASVRIHLERAIELVKKIQHFDTDHSQLYGRGLRQNTESMCFINALTTVGALRAIIDFTPSNAR